VESQLSFVVGSPPGLADPFDHPSSSTFGRQDSDNPTHLSRQPSIKVTPPCEIKTKRRLSREGSTDSTGCSPKFVSTENHIAWKRLNDDLNHLFPKQCCTHDQRRPSLRAFPSKKMMDDFLEESDYDVYHTVYGGKNNPLAATRTIGPFSKIMRRRVSTPPPLLHVSNCNLSTCSSLNNLDSIDATVRCHTINHVSIKHVHKQKVLRTVTDC
jgi:hypothetical protein